MDEQIKPVAWYAELDAPSFRDHGQKYGPEWPSSRDRLPAEQTVELDGGLMTIKHQPLYDQQAIDTLRAEVESLNETVKFLSSRLLSFDMRAERAEAEAEALRQLCRDMLPVFEAARPLVLNLERLRDATKEQCQ